MLTRQATRTSLWLCNPFCQKDEKFQFCCGSDIYIFGCTIVNSQTVVNFQGLPANVAVDWIGGTPVAELDVAYVCAIDAKHSIQLVDQVSSRRVPFHLIFRFKI
jgi:hypothetical protein